MKQIKRSRLETKQELKVLFCSIYLGGDNCKKEGGGGDEPWAWGQEIYKARMLRQKEKKEGVFRRAKIKMQLKFIEMTEGWKWNATKVYWNDS